MQIQPHQQLSQSLADLNKLTMQISDKVNNFNNKMLKVAVTDKVQAQVFAGKVQSAIDFLA